jgi:hypothetical protein
MPKGFIFKKPGLIMFFSYPVFSPIFINLPLARPILFYPDQPGQISGYSDDFASLFIGRFSLFIQRFFHYQEP